ncbi:hypothetical protein AMR77_25465 [Escherichia coli]|nr:hypothetical protein AMR77_25465 [Escherichia coli]
MHAEGVSLPRMAGLLRSLCGLVRDQGGEYEKLPVSTTPPEVELRMHEALSVVNALLPAPITINDALESLDETRRLVKARALARTYHACVSNLERLSKHAPDKNSSSLDPAVAAHQEKLRRLADTCMATLLQMYMAVGSGDCTADVLVTQAIRGVVNSDVVMEDVAIAEKALGINVQDDPPCLSFELTEQKLIALEGDALPGAGDAERVPMEAAVALPAPKKRPSADRAATERVLVGTTAALPAPKRRSSADRASATDKPTRNQRVPVMA